MSTYAGRLGRVGCLVAVVAALTWPAGAHAAGSLPGVASGHRPGPDLL
jgi:hypothetical protein